MVAFEIILLLVLREQQVSTSRDRHRGDHRRHAIVAIVRFSSGRIVSESQPMRGPTKSLARRGQCREFLGAQGDEFPLEISGGIALSQQTGDLPLDAGGRGAGMAALHFERNGNSRGVESEVHLNDKEEVKSEKMAAGCHSDDPAAYNRDGRKKRTSHQCSPSNKGAECGAS